MNTKGRSPAVTPQLTPVGQPSHTLLMAQLNQLIEPNDVTAGALLELMSPQELLSLIQRRDHYPQGLAGQLAELTGQRPTPGSAQDLKVSLSRWRKRIDFANAEAALETIQRCGGGLLTDQDPQWPIQLNDLGFGRPLCLWWRASNPAHLGSVSSQNSVSMVGSRDASDYGSQVTYELGRALGGRGFCIVSGGAYGIDAVAHRAGLSHDPWEYPLPPTITIVAGGADRLYPAGNHSLLQQVIANGVLYSEVPAGTSPTRFRFLNRNRLIAAFSRLTIITEARFRSGALNTASHAVELGRDVAAVPGSVFSPNSAGTHKLIRSGSAELISSPADVEQLLGVAPEGQLPIAAAADPRQYPTDGLPSEAALVFDVLSFRNQLSVDEVCARSGLTVIETLKALALLAERRLAAEHELGWKLQRIESK
ncbi:DNA-processing protein DprA [Glutamicibacter uratoxydans]|uniref:DNA-processing protein DprA n=1 Tax=Glutamicibacter uratoxydans TaxID=43667 RepID=UPI0014774250|nr:DNA-processing protein DprA [Glutamicibacter uratoxydans]